MFMSQAPGVQHLKKKRKVIIRINNKKKILSGHENLRIKKNYTSRCVSMRLEPSTYNSLP